MKRPSDQELAPGAVWERLQPDPFFDDRGYRWIIERLQAGVVVLTPRFPLETDPPIQWCTSIETLRETSECLRVGGVA